MALFLRQDENRSKLETKLSDDLKGKLRPASDISADEVDPAFLEDQHETKTAGMIFAAIVIALIVAALVWLVISF